ncbi:MAG TPA: isochorismatase family protein [Kofleriaceae bacterium]|nr:isochorismatase family protein [Kofleriaceae bacterium]
MSRAVGAIERLAPERAALLVVDIQERLVPAMPSEVVPQLVRNVKILVEAATRLGLPIVVSQQYPKGLGVTIPELSDVLPETTHRFDKVEFSAASARGFTDLDDVLADRDQWIVTGMETHVCVYQSVRDLVERRTVHVVRDAVASRTKANWRAGLDLMDRLGAVTTTTEVCVFDLLERAGTDNFKALSKTIK